MIGLLSRFCLRFRQTRFSLDSKPNRKLCLRLRSLIFTRSQRSTLVKTSLTEFSSGIWNDQVASGVVSQCNNDSFTTFICYPACSYASQCHRRGQVKDYLLNLSLKSKRSVLMDLASISTKYLREYSTSSRLEIISLTSPFTLERDFLSGVNTQPRFVRRRTSMLKE